MQAELMPPEFNGDSIGQTSMQLAIMALLQGASNPQAAQAAGISESTLYRMKRTQEWRDALGIAQAEVIGGARLRLVGMVHKALNTIDKLVDDASGKGAPTEASIAWGILDRVGVEVQAAQAEGVRRILTRVPREVAASVDVPPTPDVAHESPVTPSGDRPAHRIITRH